jgi:transposase
MLRMLLRDDQWERIAPLVRGKAGDRGRQGANNRLFAEAVLWLARTGSPWRDLPPEFGAWNSVYVRFARWSDKQVWQNIFQVLREDADFEEIYLDSTIVRAHQHAAGAAKKKASKLLAVLAGALLACIANKQAKAVIPPRATRKVQRPFDRHQYRNRNVIERFFARIKQFRRVATRYDKLASRFASFVALTVSLLWLQ